MSGNLYAEVAKRWIFSVSGRFWPLIVSMSRRTAINTERSLLITGERHCILRAAIAYDCQSTMNVRLLCTL